MNDKFKKVVGNVPVPYSLLNYWRAQDADALERVADKIDALGANVWAFVGDNRHYENFSDDADKALMAALTDAEAKAFLDWRWFGF